MQLTKYTLPEIPIAFKEGLDPGVYEMLCPDLHKVMDCLVLMLCHMGYLPIVTSMVREKGKIAGESGVHATGRAIDLNVRHYKEAAKKSAPSRNLNKYEADKLCAAINIAFKRSDQKMTAIYHDTGHGRHFHLQVPWSKTYIDLDQRETPILE